MASSQDFAVSNERKGYSYIEHCIAGRGVRLDTGAGALYEGCICREQNCSSIECSCMCMSAYDSRGLLKVEYFAAESRPVFECNSKCLCTATCPNRVTQNQHFLSTLRLLETESKAKGYGVRCLHFIPRGTFVGEYVGQIISKSDAKRRLDELSPSDSCYILTFKEHMSNGTVLTTTVDATYAGNITRYFNHSCSPNITMVPVRVDSIVPRLCLFANRNIPTGDELCFSYFGCSAVDLVDKRDVRLGNKKCLCGSKNCLQFLPLEN